MKSISRISYVVLLCAVFVPSSASAVQSSSVLYTPEGIVEMLIERHIISDENADRAHELVRLIQKIHNVPSGHVSNEAVEVSVSQLLEHSKLTFKTFEAVQGIVLLAKNVSDKAVTLDAMRKCQVVYKILQDDMLLYSSDESDHCQQAETVKYSLAPGQTRLFEVTHSRKAFPLSRGTYTFEVEYPGYGAGERTVIIH